MLDYPRDSSGRIYSQSVFDIRYVSLENRYVALCIVENYQQNPGDSVNIVGAYVFTPGSKEFILFQNRVPRLRDNGKYSSPSCCSTNIDSTPDARGHGLRAALWSAC